MNISQVKAFLRNRFIISIIIFVVLDTALIAAAGYGGYFLYGNYQKIQETQSTIDNLKKDVQLIQANRELLENNIEGYNEMLSTLIPDEETYFKVIAALEQLALQTGVVIDSYTLNLSDTTEDKLSLTLSIAGDRESIEDLLKEYHFISSRLMTNETVSLTFSDSITISFKINLFHKAYADSGVELTTQLKQEDVDFLKKVQAQYKLPISQ